MGFQTPRLDDRSFADLVEEARRRISLYTPEWTDHNLSDPGITLIELYAWMTDIILYRLNRVPDKHYIKFMELLGMRLREAEPARAPLTFWLSAPQEDKLTIPIGTAVSTTRTETDPVIVFSTDFDLDIHVPIMTQVMTSSSAPGGGRQFKLHPVNRVESGGQGFAIFPSSPPQPGDALYIGFEQDMSRHIIGLDMLVDTAEGAGVDPTNPPYVWEVMSRDDESGWTVAETDQDSTLSFNVDGIIRLHLPQMARGTRNDQTAYWLRCRLDPQPNVRSYNVSPQIKRLTVASWGGTVDATNVTRVRNEILGRSDGTPGQRFYLEHTPVAPRLPGENLLIRIDENREEQWTEVSDFASSKAEDRHYTIDSSSGEVRLGPALPQRDGGVQRFGQIVPQGAMLVMRGYRSGGGVIGNVAARTLNELKTSLPYVARVMNRQASYGGLDAESLESAKLRVPGHLRSLNRAVTARDFEYLTLEAAPGKISRAYCLQSPLTRPGEIKVLVIPAIPRLQGFISPESLQLQPDLREEVRDYLDERRLLATQLDVLPPDYHWVETEVRLRATVNYDRDLVRRAIETKLFNYLNPLVGGADGQGWPFGRDLFIADVMAVLLTVPGVNFVRSVRLFGVEYRDGQFTRGDELQSVGVSAQGVIASYKHEIIVD